MKTPLKDATHNGRCVAALKKKIAPRSVIDTYLFYGGKAELNLASYDRFVIAHTTNYYVHEFWDCLSRHPRKLYDIITSDVFKFDEEMFSHLQESWPMRADPYIRASLFFLLNRCSEKGLISSGELSMQNFTPVALNYLRTFKAPKNFHLVLDEEQTVISSLDNANPRGYIFVPCGDFSYNLFEEGKNKAYEGTTFKHTEVCSILASKSSPWVVSYNYHPGVLKLYEKFNITLIDKYGNETSNEQNCEEVLIANF